MPETPEILKDLEKTARRWEREGRKVKHPPEPLYTEEQAEAVMEAAVAAQSQLQATSDSFSEAEPEPLLAAQDASVARLQELLDQLKNWEIGI